ncbi:MAG TPA: hypothetical protein VG738_14305 [Chitinophagaceae bacterium]|nr:hypothetical protein [Chitinophagaceae bacterium]
MDTGKAGDTGEICFSITFTFLFLTKESEGRVKPKQQPLMTAVWMDIYLIVVTET